MDFQTSEFEYCHYKHLKTACHDVMLYDVTFGVGGQKINPR